MTTRFLLNKTEVIIDDVSYYKMDFFDQSSGEVVRVMAPVNEDVLWVKPPEVPADAQEIIEAKIREQTKVTSETGRIGDLQNDL